MTDTFDGCNAGRSIALTGAYICEINGIVAGASTFGFFIILVFGEGFTERFVIDEIRETSTQAWVSFVTRYILPLETVVSIQPDVERVYVPE